MAVMTLEYGKHWAFQTNNGPKGFMVVTDLLPEVKRWMSSNGVQHTLVRERDMKICILDNKKAMLFKLTWL